MPVKGALDYEDYNISVKLKVHEYVVSFEMNGHGTQIQDTKVCKNEPLEEPAKPVSKGFVFKGWFTKAEGGEEIKNVYSYKEVRFSSKEFCL